MRTSVLSPAERRATDWTIYLPAPEPVTESVRAAVSGASHLSAEEPPGESTSKSAASDHEKRAEPGPRWHNERRSDGEPNFDVVSTYTRTQTGHVSDRRGHGSDC